MDVKAEALAVLEELKGVLPLADAAAMAAAAERIASAPRLFFAGAGRSGLVARMIAMRLAQAGATVHVVGDATTPSIGSDDLLCLISGSGATATLRVLADKSKAAGASLFLLTYAAESPLAAAADAVVVLPIGRDASAPKWKLNSRQLLGTLFDQSALLTGDLLVREACRLRGRTEEDMAKRHANLE